MADWQLTAWQADWVSDYLTDWLIDWLACWFVDWLTDWLVKLLFPSSGHFTKLFVLSLPFNPMVCHLLSSFIHRPLLSKIYIVDSLLSMKTCPQAFIKACYVYTVSKLICRLEPRLVHNRSPLTICQLNKKWQMSKVHCIMWILPKLKNWLNSFIIMERPWYDAHCD